MINNILWCCLLGALFLAASPAYAAIRNPCIPNPNDNGPPFTDGCPISAVGLNKISGLLVSAPCHSTFTSPAAGTRGPLFIQSDCPPASLLAGQDQNIQSWMGPLLTGTPGAGGAVNATFYSDNYNGRNDIWAINAVCVQQPPGAIPFGGYTGLGAGTGGTVHCLEVDAAQALPASPISLITAPTVPTNVAHGIDVDAQPGAAAGGLARPHVGVFIWSPDDPLSNFYVTTGNTYGTTTVDGLTLLGPDGYIAIGMTVVGPDFAANTTVTAINFITNAITISAAATGTHTGTSVTFQTVTTPWWNFGTSCSRVVYSCYSSAIFSPGEHFASIGTLWDQGGTGSAVAAQGNHDIGVFNMQNMSSSDIFIAAPLTVGSNFIVKNGTAHSVGMTFDSGNGAGIFNSYIQLSDNGNAKWQLLKNTANDLSFLNIATGNSDIFVEHVSEDVYIQTGLIVGNASIAASGVHQGEIAMGKDASLAAPGANALKIGWVCGTNAGTAKLIALAGTSASSFTVLDNIGAGLTGC